jgi:methyl-accepting chemotaxis protein
MLGNSLPSSSHISGDYNLGKDGKIYKGDTCIAPYQDSLDKFVKDSDADVTLCWGKTRYITSLKDESGTRPIGTDIDDEVWETLQSGETYTTANITIMGTSYYAVYLPLVNTAGETVGAVFAGEPMSGVREFIESKVKVIIMCAVLILAAAAITSILISNKIAKALVQSGNAIKELSEGELKVDVPANILKRSDEIGDIGRSVASLAEKLCSIITGLKTSASEVNSAGKQLEDIASQTARVADDISHAVEDITKGAVSQAGEIEDASEQVSTMGELISGVVGSVKTLTSASQNMMEAGITSSSAIDELSKSNDDTTVAINNIGQQIMSTNDSIKQVGKAATLITSITEQTRLLSLNASIESARAGEAGRGFAVVASEIQKLASQSDEAADEIQQIIDRLLRESTETVDAMQSTGDLLVEQQNKLEDTKQRFGTVMEGIHVSDENTKEINHSVMVCDDSRKAIIDVINNLSALSEENAASAEETTASMQELNATISTLAESAGDLREMSEELNKSVGFFKL